MTIHHLAEVSSTNDIARKMAADGAPHLTVVYADSQHAGRGRRGREWVSPPGNLYCSIILRPDVGLPSRKAEGKTEDAWPDIGTLGQVTALAIYRAIAPFISGVTPLIKWPNDVLVNRKKISGLLIEAEGVRQTAQNSTTADFIIVGVGINVAFAPETSAPYEAVCLADIADKKAPDRDAVLTAFANTFDEVFQVWLANGYKDIHQALLSITHQPGDDLRVRSGIDGDFIKGVFKELTPDGQLVLKLADGQFVRFSAGDVFL